MNDNLKELEEFVNQNKEDGYFGLRAEMVQLIEKLILRNKELEADNKKLNKENQGLFELYHFNDASLLVKILKYYKKEIKKLTPSPTNPIPLEKQTNIWVNKKDYISKDTIRKKIEEIIDILEAKPYTAYTLYGDILHESDEIANMLKELLEERN